MSSSHQYNEYQDRQARVHFFGSGPVRERVPTWFDHEAEVLTWGRDNLYPQRVAQIVFRSGIAQAAVDNLAIFQAGRGFSEDSFGSSIVNEDLGLTVNDVLTLISIDYAFFDAFALHFRYNLALEIAEVTPVPVKFCRFGTPDEETGKIEVIRFSKNWERNMRKSGGQGRVIKTFWKYSSDPEVIDRQIAESGGFDNYPGQILFCTPLMEKYSKASYDPVLDSIQTNAEISLYELSNIQNGFNPSMVFKYPSKIQDDNEYRAIENRLAALTGSFGAGGVMVVEDSKGEPNANLLEPITVQNRDRMFEFTSRNVRETIVQGFGTRPSLVGLTAEGAMINNENLVNDYNYYNSRTEPRRTWISRKFETWVPFFMDPIAPTSYDISPAVFIQTQQTPVVVGNRLFIQNPETGQMEEVAPETNPADA